MKQKVDAVRQWVGRAKKIHEQLRTYEQALEGLADVCGTEPIFRKCDRLRSREYEARMELYEVLSKADLTPRQFSVLNLHYLQYESWTGIAKRLHIDRRYALQVHIKALERLASQMDGQFEIRQMTA